MHQESHRWHGLPAKMWFCAEIYGLSLVAYIIVRPFINDGIGIFALSDNLVPGMLFPAFVILPLAMHMKKKLVVGLCSVVVLYFLLAYGPRFLPHRVLSHEITEPSLYVLTYNVGQKYATYEQVERLVRNSNADVVFLQEITREFIDGYLVGLSDLYPFQVYGPLQGENQAGMGILSRYQVTSAEDFKLAEAGLVWQQRVSIDVIEQTIVLYNVHLTFPWIRLIEDPILGCRWPVYDNKVLLEEVDNLLLRLSLETSPIIAAGDYNMVDRTRSYKRITGLMVDSYRTSGFGIGATWPASVVPVINFRPAFPLIRIDYVMHSHDFDAISATTLSPNGSDHRPILVDLTLQNIEPYE